ncbi:MAG: PRC-barrel domain-containing protein [Pseudomonadota bacterium]
MTNTRKLFLALGLAAAGALPLMAIAADRANAAPTANPRPSASERAAAKTGNEIDKAVGPDRPVTENELKSGISLDGIENPARALATAQIKNRQGQAIGTVSSVDVAPNGKAEAIHVDVGGFLGMGTHRVAIRAGNFVYLKSRDLLVTTMSKDQIKALNAELPPHG